MSRTKVISITILLINNFGFAQEVLINEFLASNVTINPEMYDFDDYVDWIELFNPNDTTITLNNYFLTDNYNNLLKWKIPDDTSIEPEGYFIIWADDFDEGPGQVYTRPYWPWDTYTTLHYHTNFKINKDGEQLCLSRADQTGMITLIETGSFWKYLDDGTDLGINWSQFDFDDSDWDSGNAELGYGDGDEETEVGYGPNEDNKYITTYFRHSFNIEDSNNYQTLTIQLKRDDGAVVYLNGNEILRSNMPGTVISFETQANNAVSGDEENLFFEFNIPANDIVIGQNVVAVEIHQISGSSSDISFDFELSATSYSNTVIVDSTSFTTQIKDVSRGLGSNENEWYYFGEPTPGNSNNTMPTNFTDRSGQVTASLESGFYNGFQTVELITNDETEQIYYTLDGSKPGSNSNVYSSPITIESTVVLKARSIKDDKLPSEIMTETFFIDEQSFIPTLSLIADPETLWDSDIGIYENEYKQREIPVTIQYFTQETERGFIVQAGARLGGLNIWTKPQKPFTIYLRDRFDYDYIYYQLFDNKQITNFSRIVLRNGGDDWEETLIRDPMTESIVMDMMDCGYMAYSPAALFLNGNYWGVYNIREKYNTQYFYENFNADPDNIDHLEYTSTQSGTQLMVIEGDKNHYNSMINFILNNDLNQPEVYTQLQELMNLDSFIDFIVMTLFSANTSWGHNREWWRPRSGSGKWQWLMVDIDRGFNINNIYSNLLDDLIDEFSLFQYLIESQAFQDRFIQRSAAHFNNTFNTDRINGIVDSLSSSISLEMPRHIDRWGGDGGISSISDWEDELDEISQFSQDRSAVLYNQFINEFNLDGTVRINVDIDPPEAGIVSINNVLIINPDEEGVYFKNNPISLLAQPNPGYQFLGWENISDSPLVNFNCSNDSTFIAVFQFSNEEILPDIISENTHLTNDQTYVVINDLTVDEGVTLTISQGVGILMPDNGNIIIRGRLIINGTEENPVHIFPNALSGASSWGAICFDNSTDSSFISNVYINGATTGIDPLVFNAAISSINSHILLDHVDIENVKFPIYVEGGSLVINNSSITTEFICDYINVKSGNTLIENCKFYGRNAPNTDAIDLDNVGAGIIRNNRIYDFSGYNSDGIDIGENSEDIIILSNFIYHIRDKGISVGQGSTVRIENNLIVGCNSGIAIKDNSTAEIINNTFYFNDTTIACFEKNVGLGGGSAVVVNSILSNNLSMSLFIDNLSDITVRYSLSDSELIEGEGNLFSDPQFTDPSIYNLELSTNSPCIDSGDPNSQIDVDGTPADIGNYYSFNVTDYPFEFPNELIGLLKINEILARNETVNTDESGDYEDWIELYYHISTSVNLAGYSISDDMDFPQKWIFPSIDISGEGHLLLWADQEINEGEMHTNFKLSTSGEEIGIFDANGYLTDLISFQEQSEDISYGRASDGADEWQFFNNPTPGSFNYDADDLVISDSDLPLSFSLDQAYPNPFNSKTTLDFSLPIDSYVSIRVYNLLGKETASLVETRFQKGSYSVTWNADPFTSGIYFVKMTAGHFTKTHKIILIK